MLNLTTGSVHSQTATRHTGVFTRSFAGMLVPSFVHLVCRCLHISNNTIHRSAKAQVCSSTAITGFPARPSWVFRHNHYGFHHSHHGASFFLHVPHFSKVHWSTSAVCGNQSFRFGGDQTAPLWAVPKPTAILGAAVVFRHVQKLRVHVSRALALGVEDKLVVTAVGTDRDDGVLVRAEGTDAVGSPRHLELAEAPLGAEVLGQEARRGPAVMEA